MFGVLMMNVHENTAFLHYDPPDTINSVNGHSRSDLTFSFSPSTLQSRSQTGPLVGLSHLYSAANTIQTPCCTLQAMTSPESDGSLNHCSPSMCNY